MTLSLIGNSESLDSMLADKGRPKNPRNTLQGMRIKFKDTQDTIVLASGSDSSRRKKKMLKALSGHFTLR